MRCSGCGYEASSLTPTINERVAKISVDESLREAGLKSLRVRNFQTLLSRINKRLTDKSWRAKMAAALRDGIRVWAAEDAALRAARSP